MEICKRVICLFIVGFIINLLFTKSIHRLAYCLSNKKVKIEWKFLKKVKLIFMFFLSADYYIAKLEKNKYIENKGCKNENLDKNEKTELARFIQLSNYLNLFFSMLFFFISMLPFKMIFGFCIVPFLIVRTISRSFEIMYAFTKDVISKEVKKSKLNSNERIILAISSYIEIILNYSLVYYMAGLYQSETIFTTFDKYSNLNVSFFRSIGISSFTGITVQNFDYIAIIQLFTSMSLVYFAIASYLGDKTNK